SPPRPPPFPYTTLFRSRKEHRGEPPRVALELRPLGRGIAVAENQQVELVGRIPALVNLDDRPCGGRCSGSVDELVGGIDRESPDVAKGIPDVALLHDNTGGSVDQRKPQRLGKRAHCDLGLAGRLPFAVNRAEPSREDRPSGGCI